MRVARRRSCNRERGNEAEMTLHPTTDGGPFVKGIYRLTKWIKQEAGLILTTIFLVLLIRTICVIVLESRQPFFTIMRAQSPSTLVSSINLTMSPADDERPNTDTFITGTEAVERFRAHLQCFSESGKWVYDLTPRHIPWNYIGDIYASSCEIRLKEEGGIAEELAEDIALSGAPGNWSVREPLKWVWQTNSSCPWRPIDRDNFCRKIGSNNHLMIVGDSLNHQISWSVMNALVEVGSNGSDYEHLSGNSRIDEGPYEMCGDIFGEGDGIKILFVRNDRLSPIVNASVDTWFNFYEFPWLDMLEEYGVKLLLLNRGAHFEDDEKYTKALYKIFTILSLQFPHVHVIYRNTMPGHLDCMNFTTPLPEPQDYPLQYFWQEFDRQNHLAKKIVEEFHYTYMDVYSMLSLRADGHIWSGDCLHYCIPGPLDLVVEYLYNILLLI